MQTAVTSSYDFATDVYKFDLLIAIGSGIDSLAIDGEIEIL